MSQCNVGFHFGFDSSDAGKSARAKYHPGDESRPEYFTVHIGSDLSIFITPEKLANLPRYQLSVPTLFRISQPKARLNREDHY